MARRKMKKGKMFLAGLIAVGLGYLLGTWTLNSLLPKREVEDHKLPHVSQAENGEEFSERVATKGEREEREKPVAPAVVPEAEVKVEQPAAPEVEPEEKHLWRVVVSGIDEEQAAELKRIGYSFYSLGGGELQLGVFEERERAVALAGELRERGFSTRVEEKR